MDLSVYAADLATLYDKTAQMFLKKKTPSDYIGDSYQWQSAGSILCSVLPVTDKLTAELYGPRVEQMLLLHAAPGTAIADGMGIAFTAGAAEPEYTVVSVKKRMTHTYVLVEVMKIGNSGQGTGCAPEKT
jgi:hypothetical protein